MSDLGPQIAALMGSAVREEIPLSGGCVADVRRVVLADGRELVAKRGAGLLLEARMLRYLAANSAVPVPDVYHAEADLLLMEYIAAGDPDPITAPTQEHAATVLTGSPKVSLSASACQVLASSAESSATPSQSSSVPLQYSSAPG